MPSRCQAKVSSNAAHRWHPWEKSDPPRKKPLEEWRIPRTGRYIPGVNQEGYIPASGRCFLGMVDAENKTMKTYKTILFVVLGSASLWTVSMPLACRAQDCSGAYTSIPSEQGTVSGFVTAVSATLLTVKPVIGVIAMIDLAPSTIFLKNGKNVTVKDVKVGNPVMVSTIVVANGRIQAEKVEIMESAASK
jgi:hypothetical protein